MSANQKLGIAAATLFFFLCIFFVGLVVGFGIPIAIATWKDAFTVAPSAPEPAAEEPAAAEQQSAATREEPALAEEAAPESPAEPSSLTWGPAGPAPQTLASAQTVLGLDSTSAQFLTALYPEAGNPTVIGWVLGTTVSEAQQIRLTANVPSGVCVDFDPGSSTLSGEVVWSVDFTDQWRRSLLASVGTFTGLKATFYWTVCD